MQQGLTSSYLAVDLSTVSRVNRVNVIHKQINKSVLILYFVIYQLSTEEFGTTKQTCLNTNLREVLNFLLHKVFCIRAPGCTMRKKYPNLRSRQNIFKLLWFHRKC